MGPQKQIVRKAAAEEGQQAAARKGSAHQPEDRCPRSGRAGKPGDAANLPHDAAPMETQVQAHQQEAPEGAGQVKCAGPVLPPSQREEIQDVLG